TPTKRQIHVSDQLNTAKCTKWYPNKTPVLHRRKVSPNISTSKAPSIYHILLFSSPYLHLYKSHTLDSSVVSTTRSLVYSKPQSRKRITHNSTLNPSAPKTVDGSYTGCACAPSAYTSPGLGSARIASL